jgi:biopolymer transport protein ExbD
VAGGAQGRGGVISGINVTPLVDITLVLLVVFMVTAKLIATPAIEMDLPQAAHSDAVQVILSIELEPGEPARINGKPVRTDEAFVAAVRQMRAEHDDLRAVVQADGSETHRRVIHALDLLRGAGVDQIAFATQRAEVRGDGSP